MEEKKDHRGIAKELELCFFNEELGQGLPAFSNNFVIIKNEIQKIIREKWKKFNFEEVITPIIGNKTLYEKSEHLKHYKEYMFPKISRNEETFFLRPMTCPHHCLIFKEKTPSWRDLPLRIAENSFLFRYESSGSLKGMERARWMELADQHIFVSVKELKVEIKKNINFIQEILKEFAISIKRIVCSLRDEENKEKYHTDNKKWKKAETVLLETADELKLIFEKQKNEAAFYGPKLDFEVQTIDKKFITLATLQIDFLLPEKFSLKYIDNNGKTETPVIIHQSPIGTYQRFISILLEQTQGWLPLKISPCQLAILTINNTEETKKKCFQIVNKLKNFRVEILEKKTINFRIKQVYQKKIPFFFLIGKKELTTKEYTLIDSQNNSKEKVIEKELKKIIIKKLQSK